MKTSERNLAIGMVISTGIAATVWWNMGIWASYWGEALLWLFTGSFIAGSLNMGSAIENAANARDKS